MTVFLIQRRLALFKTACLFPCLTCRGVNAKLSISIFLQTFGRGEVIVFLLTHLVLELGFTHLTHLLMTCAFGRSTLGSIMITRLLVAFRGQITAILHDSGAKNVMLERLLFSHHVASLRLAAAVIPIIIIIAIVNVVFFVGWVVAMTFG